MGHLFESKQIRDELNPRRDVSVMGATMLTGIDSFRRKKLGLTVLARRQRLCIQKTGMNRSSRLPDSHRVGLGAAGLTWEQTLKVCPGSFTCSAMLLADLYGLGGHLFALCRFG